MGGMIKIRILLFGSVVAAAMIVGGVIGATGLAKATVTSANAAVSVASPTPTFKSNEATPHETGETAAQEAAENSGTRPNGPGGPGGGHPNETAAHEAGESVAREAAETAGVKPSSTP
jgi:hypothetical protein